MKVIFTFLIIFCTAQFSQAQNPHLTSILNDIKIDSLVNFVENISGEKGVVVNGNLDTIYSRHKSRPGNELAFKYIIQEFERFGLQSDSMIFSATGKNALAIQPGTLYPDKYYIICSHYDGMPNLPIAAAADDDGSGVAATLEAARVLSNYQFEYTIIYAIWDEEEQGKVGSLAYSNLANTNNDSIMGVINMDAIAWDSDNDDAAMIHVKPIGTSFQISDTIQSINTNYSIGLNLAITNPGATYSDHASFWTNGFGAVLVIEDWTFD
jgi:Zn-dependent M28 family amino/carboxypeptidase